MQGKDIDVDHPTPSLIFNEGDQAKFSHYMCECAQNVSSIVRWDVSTLRSHFDNEKDDNLIHSFCRIVNIEHKIEDLGLDGMINNRLSGGEKQRVTLAANLYYNYIQKAKVLILDEPEKGLGKFISITVSFIYECV